MVLNKGLVTDTLEVNQPEGTWRGGRNLLWDNDVLRNEDGIEQGELFVGFTIIGELLLPDDSTIFFLTGTTGDRIVRKINEAFSVSSTIVTNFNFSFSNQYPIRAKAKYKNNLDIEIVFTDDYNPPRHITIDYTNKQIIESTLDATKLFPEISIPNFVLKSVDAGGFLVKGSYFVTIAYNFGDDDYTNWVGMSNQIIVESGGQGFTIEITDLDIKFESFKVGLIRVNEDTAVIAEQSNIDYDIDVTTKTITVIGGGTNISTSGVITKSISYDKIGDFASLDNRLYAAKLYRDAVLDYQSYANEIKIEPVYDDLVALDSEEGSYGDPLIIFDTVGFQDDEIYALYIRLQLKDGTPGGDFFIPSNEENGMLFHSNTNEDYPIGKGYPAGQVKHHLFPQKAATDFLSGTSGSGEVADSVRDSGVDSQYIITADILHGIKFAAAGTGNLGTISNDPNTTYTTLTYNTITFDDTLDITVNFDLSMEVVLAGTEDITFRFEVIKNETSGGTGTSMWHEFPVNVTTVGTHTMIVNDSFNMSVAPNDALTFRAWIEITTGVDADVTKMELDWDIFIRDIIPSSDANFFTKSTGIKITNIVIPASIADKIQGYEIMYASRNGTNSRVLGQSIIYPDDWINGNVIPADGKMRFHAFDLLLNKPRIYPSGIRSQYTIGETDAVSASKYTYLGNTIADITGGDVYRPDIVQAKYIPGDNVAASNEDGEEAYTFVVKDATSLANRIIANLVSTKTDYYLGVESQILQSTGIIHKVTTSGTYSVDKLYGGDCYTCLYDLRLTKKRPTTSTDSYIRNTKIPVQSRFNICLREWGEAWQEQPELLYPPSSEYLALGLDDTTLIAAGHTTLAERIIVRSDYTKKYSNYFDYDEGFSFGNRFIQAKIQGDILQDYPFRLIRSPEQNVESKTSSWRTFLPNDYYEQNRERGIINNIEVLDTDKLIIHHTNGLFITMAKERLAANVTEIVLGVGDIFGQAPKEIIYTGKGFLGSTHKFANFVCELGYVFISEGKIYTLSSQLKDISVGNEKFFLDNLNTGDNPYLQNKNDGNHVGGISMAYDKRYERLLLTVNASSGTSYTMSYSKKLQAWVCNHDYTDSKLYDIGRSVYSIVNNSTDARLYVHSSPTFAIYYDSMLYDSMIQVVANRNNIADKVFLNFNWKLTGLNTNRNFETIQAVSDLHDTGVITIVPYTGDIYDFDVNCRKMHSTWSFNKISIEGADYSNQEPLLGLFAKVELVLDNTANDKVSIIDIDSQHQIVKIQ